MEIYSVSLIPQSMWLRFPLTNPYDSLYAVSSSFEIGLLWGVEPARNPASLDIMELNALVGLVNSNNNVYLRRNPRIMAQHHHAERKTTFYYYRTNVERNHMRSER